MAIIRMYRVVFYANEGDNRIVVYTNALYFGHAEILGTELFIEYAKENGHDIHSFHLHRITLVKEGTDIDEYITEYKQ